MTFPPASYGADSPVLSYGQVEGYWIAAGGPSSLAATMAAIATAESGRRPARVQEGQPYATTGWGLWQITPGNKIPPLGVDQALLDPLTNARAAVDVWRAQDLKAWTTYNTGAYRQYLEAGVPPVMPTHPPIVSEDDMQLLVAYQGSFWVVRPDLTARRKVAGEADGSALEATGLYKTAALSDAQMSGIPAS